MGRGEHEVQSVCLGLPGAFLEQLDVGVGYVTAGELEPFDDRFDFLVGRPLAFYVQPQLGKFIEHHLAVHELPRLAIFLVIEPFDKAD